MTGASSDEQSLADVGKWTGRLVLAAAIFLFFHFCKELWQFKIDDAYITYRYGARLAHFGNMRWNLMEPPVEGFTSILSNFISAGFEFLRLDPLYAWKIMSVVLSLGATGMIFLGSRIFCGNLLPTGNDWGLPYFIAALYPALPITALHAMSGMETGLYSFLLISLTTIAFALIFGSSSRIGRYWLLFMGFLLLGLTRPEGVLWGAIVTVAVGISLPRAEWGRYARSFLVFFFLPGLVYFIARWIYFGDFLSPTFFAKSGNAMKPGQGRLMTYLPSRHEVYAYLRDFWMPFMVFAIIGAVAAIFRFGKIVMNEYKAKITSVIVIFTASLLCIEFFSAMHMLMGYAHRFLYPYGQTFLLALVLPGIALAIKSTSPSISNGRVMRPMVYITVAFIIGLSSWKAHFAYKDSIRFFSLLKTNNVQDDGYTRTGKALDAVAERVGRQLTLFHHNMGEMMYFAPHWDTIEALGLIDRYTAHHGFHNDYVFDMRNPELLLLPSSKAAEITPYASEFLPDISKVLYDDPRMNRYTYIGYFPDLIFGTEGRMHFFFRNDLLSANAWMQPFLTEKLHLMVPSGIQKEAR